jgi:hypothetical protein
MSKRLVAKLDHSLDEVLNYDLWLGLLGLAGGIWLALESPKTLANALPVAIGVVGVVIGTVIAGVAVIAAFLDATFIRKLRLIDKKPERYVTPFAFTAALGVVSALALLLLSGLPPSAPTWLLATTAAVAGLFTVWTIASLLPLLSVLLDFVGLKGDAADVPDEAVADDANVRQLKGKVG